MDIKTKLSGVNKLVELINNRKKSDNSIKLMILVFMFGYLFFFTSKYTFPKVYTNAETTKPGDIITSEDYQVTFDAWEYCKFKRTYQIFFELENLSLNDMPELVTYVKSGDKILSGEIIKQYNNYYIARVPKTSNYVSTVEFKINIGDQTLSIITTDKDMTKTNLLYDIQSNEIESYVAKNKIKTYEDKIKVLESEQEEIGKKLEISVARITAQETNKQNQTKLEQEQTDKKIEKLISQTDELKARLDDIMAEIKELEEKIKHQENLANC